MTSSVQKKLHAIIVPIPYPGLINPAIDFAHKLASSKGFAITYVNLEFVHHQMMSKFETKQVDIFCHARKSGLDIRYRTVGDGFPLEFDRVLHLEEYWESMMINFPARIDELVGGIIKADSSTAHFLVADTAFLSWPASVAKKYNIVNVSFWTEPAIVFSLIYHAELLREKGHFPCKDDVEDEITYLPGIESISTKDFMPYLKESEVESIVHKCILSAFKEVPKADFILHNTVYELESETLSALNKYQPHYAIGPIYFSKNLPADTIHKSICPETDCTEWLAAKPPRSVLYVSFGSLVMTSRHNIEEIAHGILLSEVNFIWVVRPGIAGEDGTHGLPDGFEDRIQEKGLIVPWCNQVKLLSDPAMGGFLTHCGWNSTLESIWFGVPMICYPLNFDQPTNRKLVVDDWKIGISLCDGTSPNRREVAEKIRSAMSGSASKGIHQNMMAVREKIRNALESNGSSERNIDRFAIDLKAKIDSMNERGNE